MKINVKVKTNAKENKIEKIDDKIYKVLVIESPKEGKANDAIIELLADYFDVSKSNVEIIRGKTSKNKVIEIIK